jgi:hypothetical protein
MKFVHKSIGVLAVGFLVLTFWSVLLYWSGEGCDRGLRFTTFLSGSFRTVDIPEIYDIQVYSSLANLDIWNRPRVTDSYIDSSSIAVPRYVNDFLTSGERRIRYFNKFLKVEVQYNLHTGDEKYTQSEAVVYAGPNGMSKKIDIVGRFSNVVMICNRSTTDLVYDKGTHQFYLLDFEKRIVKASRKYSTLNEHQIAEIFLTIYGVKIKDKTDNYIQLGNRALVLDKSGQLDWFDLEKMDFAGRAGYVPNYDIAYAYRILPIKEGLITASITKEINPDMSVAVFESGNLKNSQTKNTNQLYVPGGSSLLAGKCLVDNLYSPVLLLGTYAERVFFGIQADESSLYLPLNSIFVNMKREAPDSYWEHLGRLLLIFSPAWMLSYFLASRVKKNAISFGLSKPACLTWYLLTLFFGVPAYITWRIVRPKEVMVTCKNCGKLRRVEFERCQHCKSPWFVPEITPPMWRVIGSPEMEKDEVAVQEKIRA